MSGATRCLPSEPGYSARQPAAVRSTSTRLPKTSNSISGMSVGSTGQLPNAPALHLRANIHLPLSHRQTGHWHEYAPS